MEFTVKNANKPNYYLKVKLEPIKAILTPPLSESERNMIETKLFHPFRLIGIKTPNKLSEFDDVSEHGFSLDLTTEMFYFTYDWGQGLNCRFLGFGFEICIVEK